MTTTPDTYPIADRRWFGTCALTVAAHALVEHRRWGGRRYTLWSQVTGVRWAAHGSAEIVRAGGLPPITLPAGTPRLPELVAAVERLAQERQAEWREHGVPERQICDWLGIEPGGCWHSRNHQPMARLGGLLLVGVPLLRLWSPGAPLAAGLLLVAVVLAFVRNRCLFELLLLMPAAVLALGIEQGAPLAATLLLAAVGVALTVRGLLSAQGSPLMASGRELSGGTHDERWAIQWRALRAVDVTDDGWRQQVRLTTDTGSHGFHGARVDLAPLMHAVERVVEANTAEFVASDGRVPETALSPARMDNDENDRSLSLAGR